MVVIQPDLLFETEKQAKVLEGGLKTICYELGAPKDEVSRRGRGGRSLAMWSQQERGLKSAGQNLTLPSQIVELIINNQSVLHGRQLHLSVADVAHLSILRQPKGRIVD